jgi:predicted dehydrogenase
MKKVQRRAFLKTSTAAAAALTVAAPSAGRALGASDRIRAGVVGVRGRGASHISELKDQKDVEVAALCDVDRREIDRKLKGFGDRQPATYVDVRKLLDDKSIQVVSIATPNHWHSLMGIWACQAGKDVYVEKPCSHNIFEGRKLVEAARKHGRIVQHGTQIRSSEAIREGVAKLQEGVIGEVYMARGLCYKWRNSIGRKPDASPPSEVDYNLWLGPAPDRPFSENRFHYNWHWHWDYGNGDLGNQGVHQMDIARWGLGVGLPRLAQGVGGHFLFEDDQETPNTIVTSFSYPEEKKLLVFEVRHWMTNDEAGATIGVIFYGSEGYMVVPSYDEYRVFLGRDRKPGPARKAGGDHFANFIAAVRARKPEILHADIEEGHFSSALCHLGNMSYRLGRAIRFDPDKELCIGDDEANALLTRKYREPFVVPLRV